MLTSEQVAGFRHDGFVAVDRLLDPAEVARLRAATSDPVLLAGRAALGGGGHQFDVAAAHPVFRELGGHERLLDLVEALIGPDIQIHHTKLATKPVTAGAGPVAWHQDFPFLPHTNTDLVAAFVYLDDATVDNGCMSFVRGSHRLGPLSHYDEATGEFTSECQEPRHWADPSRHVALEVPAGGVSLHHCLVLHSSSPNLSGAERRGVVMQYRAADAVQLGGPVFVDTGRQVRGQFREHARCSEQVVRLPRLPATVLRGHDAYRDDFGAYDRNRGELAFPAPRPLRRTGWSAGLRRRITREPQLPAGG